MPTTLSPASKRRTASDAASALVFSTSLGWIAFAVKNGAIARLTFGSTTAQNALRRLAIPVSVDKRPSSAWLRDLVERLVAYADGEVDEFRDVPITDDHLTPFGRAVVTNCRSIGYGRTRAYGELAALAGRPGAARAVGQVMAGNTVPLIVPCHRVVAAGGLLGGFSAPQGLAMKRRLLALESGQPPRPYS
jgi:methylated-DNA-[protein]-cysteine S-methyltransferase